MREARGKGFVLSLLRGHPQHGPEDLHIGEHDESKTPQNQKTTKCEKPNFPEVGVSAGELENLGDFTEELVHSIALAEGQCCGLTQPAARHHTTVRSPSPLPLWDGGEKRENEV